MANDRELGALWIKNGSKGTYMTGNIKIGDTVTEIVCFTNQNKKEAKHPDWRILLSVPKEQAENAQPGTEEINPDDIPF